MMERFEVHCRIRFEFQDESSSSSILQALEVDDQDFVTTRVEGKTLIMETRCDSVGKLIHTLDDYLSCIQVAEGSVSLYTDGKVRDGER